MHKIVVRTDLGTESGPHSVHCRSTQCQSFFRSASVQQYLQSVSAACLLWHWPLIINMGGCYTCLILSVPRYASAGTISYTAARLDYQLITNYCRKHGTFHHNSSISGILDQLWLGRFGQHKIIESVWSSICESF